MVIEVSSAFSDGGRGTCILASCAPALSPGGHLKTRNNSYDVPFGYTLDLDFVRFCSSVVCPAPPVCHEQARRQSSSSTVQRHHAHRPRARSRRRRALSDGADWNTVAATRTRQELTQRSQQVTCQVNYDRASSPMQPSYRLDCLRDSSSLTDHQMAPRRVCRPHTRSRRQHTVDQQLDQVMSDFEDELDTWRRPSSSLCYDQPDYSSDTGAYHHHQPSRCHSLPRASSLVMMARRRMSSGEGVGRGGDSGRDSDTSTTYTTATPHQHSQHDLARQMADTIRSLIELSQVDIVRHVDGATADTTSAARSQLHLATPACNELWSAGSCSSPRRNTFTRTVAVETQHQYFSTADKHDVSADKHGVSADKHGVSTYKHGVSADKRSVSADKHDVSTYKHGFSADRRSVSAEKRSVSADKHDVSADYSVLDDDGNMLVSDGENNVSPDRDSDADTSRVSTDREGASADKDIASVSRDVSADNSDVIADRETVCTHKDDVSFDRVDVNPDSHMASADIRGKSNETHRVSTDNCEVSVVSDDAVKEAPRRNISLSAILHDDEQQAIGLQSCSVNEREQQQQQHKIDDDIMITGSTHKQNCDQEVHQFRRQDRQLKMLRLSVGGRHVEEIAPVTVSLDIARRTVSSQTAGRDGQMRSVATEPELSMRQLATLLARQSLSPPPRRDVYTQLREIDLGVNYVRGAFSYAESADCAVQVGPPGGVVVAAQSTGTGLVQQPSSRQQTMSRAVQTGVITHTRATNTAPPATKQQTTKSTMTTAVSTCNVACGTSSHQLAATTIISDDHNVGQLCTETRNNRRIKCHVTDDVTDDVTTGRHAVRRARGSSRIPRLATRPASAEPPVWPRPSSRLISGGGAEERRPPAPLLRRNTFHVRAAKLCPPSSPTSLERLETLASRQETAGPTEATSIPASAVGKQQLSSSTEEGGDGRENEHSHTLQQYSIQHALTEQTGAAVQYKRDVSDVLVALYRAGLYTEPEQDVTHTYNEDHLVGAWFDVAAGKQARGDHVTSFIDILRRSTINENDDTNNNRLAQYIVNVADVNGNTVLHYAISHGNMPVVTALLASSSLCTDSVDRLNCAGYTCLMLLAVTNVTITAHTRQTVRALVHLANVDATSTQHGQTALMLAASHGRDKMVQLLLQRGADVNIQDMDGSSALMCAAEHGHVTIVSQLLGTGRCDVTLTDHDGSSAVQVAAQSGHRALALLLHARAAPSSRPSSRSSCRGEQSFCSSVGKNKMAASRNLLGQRSKSSLH